MELQIPFQSRSHFARLSPANSNSICDTKECDSPIYNRHLYIYSVCRIMNAGYMCTRRSIEGLNRYIYIYIYNSADFFFLSPYCYLSRDAIRPICVVAIWQLSRGRPSGQIIGPAITANKREHRCQWSRLRRLPRRASIEREIALARIKFKQTERGEIWFKYSSAC